MSAYVNGWWPIESAPMEGDVLVCWRSGERWFQAVAWWERSLAFAEGAGWTDGSSDRDGDIVEIHPTHWMPLPAPPSDQPKRDEESSAPLGGEA